MPNFSVIYHIHYLEIVWIATANMVEVSSFIMATEISSSIAFFIEIQLITQLSKISPSLVRNLLRKAFISSDISKISTRNGLLQFN